MGNPINFILNEESEKKFRDMWGDPRICATEMIGMTLIDTRGRYIQITNGAIRRLRRTLKLGPKTGRYNDIYYNPNSIKLNKDRTDAEFMKRMLDTEEIINPDGPEI